MAVRHEAQCPHVTRKSVTGPHFMLLHASRELRAKACTALRASLSRLNPALARLTDEHDGAADGAPDGAVEREEDAEHVVGARGRAAHQDPGAVLHERVRVVDDGLPLRCDAEGPHRQRHLLGRKEEHVIARASKPSVDSLRPRTHRA